MNVLGTVSPGCLVHLDETSFSCNSLKGNDRIYYSIREIDTVMELLHLVSLVKQEASFNKSENHATMELQQPGGVSSQFSIPYMIEFGHFITVTLKEVDAYVCYLLLKSI